MSSAAPLSVPRSPSQRRVMRKLGLLNIFKNLIQNKVANHKSAFFKILIKIKSLESKILVKQRSFQAVFAVQDVVVQTIRHFPSRGHEMLPVYDKNHAWVPS